MEIATRRQARPAGFFKDLYGDADYMAHDERASLKHDNLLSRIARNVAWLLGGKGFVAVTSLVYLAAAARALGPERFGTFTLVLTYGQLIANIVQFQSWKGVIRFGAVHLAEGRPNRLARLLGFTATLDWSAAVVGALVGAAGACIFAPLFHWSWDVQREAAGFAVAVLLASGATPTGMLRLFDRFDLLTYSEAVAPAVRLIGAVSAWLMGGGVVAFLSVWALASLAQTIATWIAVILIHGSRLSIGRTAYRRVLAENAHLWRFMVQTSVSGSLGFVWMQASTLAVGAVAGAATAGGFRLADRLATGITKPTETVTRVLYPELARLVANDDHATLRKLFVRTCWLSAGLAALVILICAFAGRLILSLVAGPQFAFAQPFLLLLAISAGIDLTGFALEPFHNAHGRSDRVLRARVWATAIYVILLAVLLPTVGAIGAALAAIVTSAIVFVQLALSARDILGTNSPDLPVMV